MTQPRTITAIAAIGDVADQNCWSGIPYHFYTASRRQGWQAAAIRLPVEEMKSPRLAWNLKQLLRGHGRGGYQYSSDFQTWAWKRTAPTFDPSHVLSFHAFFPAWRDLEKNNGQLSLYLDATHELLLDRYNLREHVSKWMQQEMLKREREALHQARRLIFFQRWAAKSAIESYGINSSNVFVVLPGANLEVPANFRMADMAAEPGLVRPLYLGFVGKDWRRKGFLKLLVVVEGLARMGIKVILRCAGSIPDEAQQHPCVEYRGFISKKDRLADLLNLMASCDFGCLLSDAEASSIAILEFLRLGVPVISTIVDGMGDLVPPDAGIRILPDASSSEIAEMIAQCVRNPDRMAGLRGNARRWAGLMTWDRCVREIDQVLAEGKLNGSVRPWLGLAGLQA